MPLSPSFAYRSFWPRQNTVKDFADRGVNLVCIFPANTNNSLGLPYCDYPPHWVHLGVYRWEIVDQQFDDILKANPGAHFLCMIDLNTPDWQVRFSFGQIEDSFLKLGDVAGSQDWRKQTGDYLIAFLNHCEEKYGSRIEGYILACGMTCEWQDWARGEESNSRREAWRQWCINRGHGDPIDIPTLSQRTSCSRDLLRDPVTDALAIRYWDFNRWLIADAIQHFAGLAQSIIHHRVALGVFYGYIFEHGQGRLVREGCLGLDTIYASDDLDFFIAPASYRDRHMGGGSGFMSPISSIKLHGKSFIQELDHFTHTANGNPLGRYGIKWGEWNYRWTDEASSIAGMQREFTQALIYGVSLWWFDMWNHWYETPEILAAIKQMKSIWDCQKVLREPESVSQIAVLADVESCLYLNEDDPRVNDILHVLRSKLGGIGAPYDLYSMNDLGAIDFQSYKLVIIPNLFVCNADKRKAIQDKLCRDGRTVLWIYKAGVIADGRYDEAHIERLTGLPFSPGQISRKNFGHWRSVLQPDLKPDVSWLREIAISAGVHVYSDTQEPVYVNSRLLATHSANGGQRRLALPRRYRQVRELFTNRIVATDCTEFTDTLLAPGTVLYELQ